MLALAQGYWKLIRSAKIWLIVTLCLFALGVAGAVVIGIVKPTLIEQVVEHLHGNPETGFRAFVLYLENNLRALLITWCGGFVPAIVPLFNILATGFILGSLLVDRGVLYSFLSIVPHGIVEIPAYLLANAFSLRLGLRWIVQKTAGERKRTFVTDLQNSLKIGLLCMFLIVIAAMIETFATPTILTAYERGHLAGIGVQLAVHEHQITITHVFPDRPASKAGLVSGLVIHTIDGNETTGKNPKQCRDMITGRVGTRVKLELIDTVQSKTNTVELVRDLSPL
jgi:stage II sporulation protein M